MRPSSCCFWAALLLLLGVCAAQGPDCNAAIVTLLPCLDYVQGNVSSPSASCCTGLASVVKTSPSCLCVLTNDSALPIRVDPVRATQLPAVCNVTSPTVIVCGGAVSPVGIPVSSPAASAPAAVPVVAPVAGTPPPTVATPGTAPSVSKAPSPPPATAPSTPPTTPPTVSPTVAPAVAPAVSPPPAPTAEVPVPAPATKPPTGAPILTPTSVSPLPALSSPPAPPPNGSDGVAIAVSLVMSGFAMVLSSFLFLQM